MLERPLQKIIPTADLLLKMQIEDLAPILLKLAYDQRQAVGFIPHAVSEYIISDGYPGFKKDAVDKHLTRAWNWVERQGLIEPSPDINGRNGWRMFSEDGEAIANGARLDVIHAAQEFPRALLHSDIISRCEKLFFGGHYAEATEMSFRVVRDRLRDLTGCERGADAVGKGLHITGAIEPHVDEDFNAGVKFLTMAIDRFRNEKAHTSEIGINDPTKALQYMVMSSLAMRLLENSEIKSRAE